MYDIIIVGAGPAGLSAAIYGVRSGKTVLVLEKSGYGGQIINTPEIENYPGIKNVSGYDFATNLYEQAKDLGAKVVYEEVTEKQREQIFRYGYTTKTVEKSRHGLGLSRLNKLVNSYNGMLALSNEAIDNEMYIVFELEV